MDGHMKDMAMEETDKLRDALKGGDGGAAYRAIGRLSSLLARVMPGFGSGAEGPGATTPLWMFVQPMLERLRLRKWTARRDVNGHIESSLALTAGDLEVKSRRTSRGVVAWKYDTLWLKLLLKIDGLVEDNGRRGPASRWRITPKGGAMLRLMRAAPTQGAEEIARKWYVPAEAAYRGRNKR